MTYYRRYAMGGLFNIATEEDDDGNAASGKQPKVEKPSPTAVAIASTPLAQMTDAELRTAMKSGTPEQKAAAREELTTRKGG